MPKIDRTEKIFQLFRDAVNLKYGDPDFSSNQQTYIGLRDYRMTKEQIFTSVEFTGFVDGHEGRAKRSRNITEMLSTARSKKTEETDLLNLFGKFKDKVYNPPDLSEDEKRRLEDI